MKNAWVAIAAYNTITLIFGFPDTLESVAVQWAIAAGSYAVYLFRVWRRIKQERRYDERLGSR